MYFGAGRLARCPPGGLAADRRQTGGGPAGVTYSAVSNIGLVMELPARSDCGFHIIMSKDPSVIGPEPGYRVLSPPPGRRPGL